MAVVATCPQCKHELLVPEAVDPAAWAKCPQCRAFFQIADAPARELPVLLLADASVAQASVADSNQQAGSTLDDLSSLATWSAGGKGSPETVVASDSEAETVLAEPREASFQEQDELQAASQRIDVWFRSSKAASDSPPLTGGEVASEPPADFAPDGELQVAPAPEPPVRTGTWDDPQHMERLFADIQPPRPARAVPREPAAEDAAEMAAPAPSDAAKQVELPKFVAPTNVHGPRKRSPMRTMILSAVAGVVGLAVGYYVLLWLRGESGDFLEVAHYLPPVVLPAEFDEAPRQAAPSEFAAAVERAEVEAAAAEDEPAEMQAAYTAPDEGGGRDLPSDDEAHDTETTETAPPLAEPAPLEAAAAAPLVETAPPDDVVRPEDAPTFTPAELSTALQAATEAQASLVQGKLKDGREVQRAKGYGYSMLADLALKAAFADAADDAPVEPLLENADRLFQQTLAAAHTRSEVAQILPKWLMSPHRKHGGVFFAATLDGQQPAGAVVEYQATLDSGQSLGILVPKLLAERTQPSRPVVIVGWIVDHAAEQLPGYTGESEQAVWAARLIPLE